MWVRIFRQIEKLSNRQASHEALAVATAIRRNNGRAPVDYAAGMSLFFPMLATA